MKLIAHNKKTGDTAEVEIFWEEIDEAMMDGACEASGCEDGCTVEPDGHCCHGWPSPLLVMGVI